MNTADYVTALLVINQLIVSHHDVIVSGRRPSVDTRANA